MESISAGKCIKSLNRINAVRDPESLMSDEEIEALAGSDPFDY